jgi:hypothetical protein
VVEKKTKEVRTHRDYPKTEMLNELIF